MKDVYCSLKLVVILAYIHLIFYKTLETNGLLLDNCRGQSYDNTANMAGHYNGVQALLKQKN